MVLISFSIIEISSWIFLKIKTPLSRVGNLLICSSKASYPRRRSKFLLTASLVMFFGVIKEIHGVFWLLVNTNLKVKFGVSRIFPSLNIFSTVFLSALFFLESICNQKKVIQKVLCVLFFFFVKVLFGQF